jgi:DNA (cytosine-5)-methyltransferase 1
MIQVVNLFSGCGGLSYGFHEHPEAFEVLGAIDFDQHANKTYQTNFGLVPQQVDIASVAAEEFVEMFGIASNRPLVLVGGPPCQGFSSHKKKDKRKDNRNSLVVRYVELGIESGSDVIIIENVPDLFANKHWGHYGKAKAMLEENGYIITSFVLSMAEYGVPQERFRAVVAASKKKPIPLPNGVLARRDFKTVRQAISHLPPLEAGQKCAIDPMHITSKHRRETIQIFEQIPPDGGDLPKGVGPSCLDGVKGFTDVYGRLMWDQPSVTITARCRTPSCGRFLHPEQHRGLTVREAALLQGFPGDFYFEGPFDDKYKQIGNAVPPPFSEILAVHLSDWFEGKRLDGKVTAIQKPIGSSFSTLISYVKKGKTIDEVIL